MKKILIRSVLSVAFIAFTINTQAQTTYSLAGNNGVFAITNIGDSVPANVAGPYTISGIMNGQTIVAITTRPNHRATFALAYDYAGGLGQLYRVTNSNDSFMATAVGTATAGLTLTQDNAVGRFAFTTVDYNEIMLTDARNNSYKINTNDGSIANVGNDITTGVNDLSINNDNLLVYPNPTTSTTRIVLPEASTHEVSVNVLDMNGRVVNSYQYANGTYQLDMDMSPLPVGLYSVHISQRGMPEEDVKVVKE